MSHLCVVGMKPQICQGVFGKMFQLSVTIIHFPIVLFLVLSTSTLKPHTHKATTPIIIFMDGPRYKKLEGDS